VQSLSRLCRLSAFAVSSLLSYSDFTFVTLNLIFLAICIISRESLLIANIGVGMEVYKKVVDLDLLFSLYIQTLSCLQVLRYNLGGSELVDQQGIVFINLRVMEYMFYAWQVSRFRFMQ